MRGRSVILAIIFLAAVGAFALRAHWYWPFMSDDAFISLRYAHRLLEGHGLTWNDGERVEGYSNLLWLLLTAGLGRLGVDLITAVRDLGIAASVLTLAIIVWSQRKRETSLLGVAVAVIGLAATNTFSAWAAAGLEQPLLMLLVTSAALLAMDRPRIAGVLLGLAATTRPDGILFAVAMGGVIWWSRDLRKALPLIAIPAAFYVAQLAFRLTYYGDWVPNTAHAKLALSAMRLRFGGIYVWHGLKYMLPLVLAVIVLAMRAFGPTPVRRPAPLVIFAPAILWIIYLLCIGGDTFPAHRQFLPILGLCALAAIDVIDRYKTGVALAFVAALALGQRFDIDGAGAKSETWEWQSPVVADFLKRAFPDAKPVIAVDAAGSLPYFSELPAIDMLGLNDKWIAAHPPADFGNWIPGHELGDGHYVLSREPDLIQFGGPTGTSNYTFLSEQEMKPMKDFKENYRLVYFDTDKPDPIHSRMWMRLNSAKVGMQRDSTGRATIPGVLLADGHPAVASLGLDDRLTTFLPAGSESRLTDAPCATDWPVAVTANGPVEAHVVPGELGVDVVVHALADVQLTSISCLRTRLGGRVHP